MVNAADNNVQKGGGNLPSVSTPQGMTLREFDTTMVQLRTSLFSEKELAELKGYLLNENGALPGSKAIGDLFNLSRDLVQKMACQIREAKGEWAKAQMQVMEKDAEIEALREEVAQLKEKTKAGTAKDEHSSSPALSEMGMDSVELAKALCYRSKENGHILYQNQMQSMMYILYGKMLARSDARLTREHPQMWEYGPVFPRVYSKVKATSEESYREQSETLKEQAPEVSRLLDETVSRCSWRGCKELLSTLVASGTPCELSRRRNPEKKAVPMEDGEIRDWFRTRS